LETPSFRFPLQAGGTKSRFPSRSGGNLQEGGTTRLTLGSPEKLSGYQPCTGEEWRLPPRVRGGLGWGNDV